MTGAAVPSSNSPCTDAPDLRRVELRTLVKFGTATRGSIDNGGGFAFWARTSSAGDDQKGVSASRRRDVRRGEHTIKWAGSSISFGLNWTVTQYTNPSFYYFNPGPTGNFDQLTQQPEAARISTGANPASDAHDVQVGLYLQDEWKPDEHWTVNGGFDTDDETNANNNDYIATSALAAALRAYPGWAGARHQSRRLHFERS